jgi:hypothetical protein
MSEISDRKKLWRPPERPDWVQRINEEGYCMNIRGIVPLDPDSLMKSAMESTGLSDFGASDWYEPFRGLANALNTEAQLNLMGRIRTRSEMLQLLEARLQIEDTYKRHPEIENEKISQPFIVLGQGRSGTSFLLNLLAASPENGALRAWEAIFPCPPPEAATYRTDPRIERGHKLIDQWNRVTPNMRAMHEFSGELPMECAQVMALNFNSPQWFAMYGQVPSYNAQVMNLDVVPTLRYHRRVLKLLQWKNPRKHWALKSISHLDMLPQLLQVYPDACFVWPHRDPIRALASALNFMATSFWGRSDFPLKDDSFDAVLDPKFSAMRMEAVIDQLESGVIPKRQMYNLLYQDLIRDPLAMIANIYQYFSITFTERARAGIGQYIAENPREVRPPHKVDKGSEAMIARDRQTFRRYSGYFHVPNE